MAGEFLLSFFEERGAVTEKPNGEADVLCPFEHDKGYEKRPSAHINLEKGTFHCKTCRAEGRFSNGGLSEINFAAKIHSISYREAVKLIAQFEDIPSSDGAWQGAVNALLKQGEKMKYLANRGITEEEVLHYKLGYDGSGIVYPVYMYGDILDKRTYNMSPKEGEPKIKSQAGATPLLFPFDHWRKTETPTLLVGGENDALLGRKLGFNALTSTGGEGTFPAVFLGLFNGKTVYIAYDCDEAGRKGALTVAFKLKEAGANVYIVDLGLAGTKEDKDLTDFVIKHGYGADELQEKIDAAKLYDGEQFLEAKNEHYPLVNLLEVNHGEYSNKYISAQVIMSGKIESTHGMSLEAPTACEYQCNGGVFDEAGKSPCYGCPFENKKGWWMLENHNLDQLLELVEVPTVEQDKAIRRFIGLPNKCPNATVTKREKQHVQKVLFTPDIETENELSGYTGLELLSYVVDQDLKDGERYRIFFKRYPHPKTQGLVAVVDRHEASDAGINAFKMNHDMYEQLSQFQGHPNEVMEKRFKLGKEVISPSTPRAVFEAVNIMYHSVLDFKFHRGYMKGHPEGLIVGASRTGKTETAIKWLQFLGIGNSTNAKSASVAGLIGGNVKMPSGGFKITWGTIPRNNKGMLIIDEMSGIPQHVISQLTSVRSERKAEIEKIASGKAQAKTRLLWISNQRDQKDNTTLPIEMYKDGVTLVRELVGKNEDIARFDFIVTIPEVEVLISPFESPEDLPDIDNTPYKNLVYWAWSRKQDEIEFAPNVAKYIWNTSLEMNDKYDTRDLNIFGAEAYKKLARIAVSVAAMCFSNSDAGRNVLVRKEHVDWARDFLIRCYDNRIFNLASYVEQQRELTETNEMVDAVFASVAKAHSSVIKLIGDRNDLTTATLSIVSGLDKETLGGVLNNLIKHGLVTLGGYGALLPTLRFKKARLNYVNGIQKQKLIPLSEEGVIDV